MFLTLPAGWDYSNSRDAVIHKCGCSTPLEDVMKYGFICMHCDGNGVTFKSRRQAEVRCECGSDKAGLPTHSTWCPKENV